MLIPVLSWQMWTASSPVGGERSHFYPISSLLTALAVPCPVNSSTPSWCLIYSKTLFGVSVWSHTESCCRRTPWLNVTLWCNLVDAKSKQGFRESKHSARNISKATWADWAVIAPGFTGLFGSEFHHPAVFWLLVTSVIITLRLSLQDEIFSVRWR